MDVAMAIRNRLVELGMDQRELARAAQVTESYISQLMTRRRMPPAPHRTDIYEKMDTLLKLPRGELAKLAAHQRMASFKRELGADPAPLFGEVRTLILKKCHPDRQRAVRAIFELHPFGELERMVTNTIIELVKNIATTQLDNADWLGAIAKFAGRSAAEGRVVTLEFLDTDIMQLSPEMCVAFIDPVIKSWDIDLPTFAMEVEMNPEVSPEPAKRFGFVERTTEPRQAPEPGFADFMENRAMSGDATDEETAFLSALRFPDRPPTALFYYRALQNLRDPLNFGPSRKRSSAKRRRLPAS